MKTGVRMDIDDIPTESARLSKTPYTFSSSPRALYNNRKMMVGGWVNVKRKAKNLTSGSVTKMRRY